MARLFRVVGVEDRQIHVAVGEMNRAVFGAVHFLEIEDFFVELCQFFRLASQNSEMA